MISETCATLFNDGRVVYHLLTAREAPQRSTLFQPDTRQAAGGSATREQSIAHSIPDG